MEKELRLRIIETLRETINAIKNNNIQHLKTLSDNVIHSASILQTQYPLEISTLLYSLGKIYERERYHTFKSWKTFDNDTKFELQNMIETLERDNEKGFQQSLKKYFTAINGLDKRLRHYIQEVLETAKTSKAARIYEHGISMAQTANILNVPQYELMKYIGTTGIADAPFNVSGNIKKRLDIARSLFK